MHNRFVSMVFLVSMFGTPLGVHALEVPSLASLSDIRASVPKTPSLSDVLTGHSFPSSIPVVPSLAVQAIRSETETSVSSQATSTTVESTPTTTEITTESAVTEVSSNTTYVPTLVGDPVLYWNEIALQALADDHSGIFGPPEQFGPGPASRALAIVHAAIYDAVNSIDRTGKPYSMLFPVSQTLPVSLDAAVAEAAYKSLITLYPAQKSSFDAALQAHTSLVPNGVAKTLGTNVGRIVSVKILNERRRDGSEKDKTTPYISSNQPGRHRPDPLNSSQSIWGSGWGKVKPFALQSGSQFRSLPPPALTSQEYADAFEEVKNYGGDGITTPMHRDQNQTDMGIYWGYDGVKKLGPPPRLYNQIAREIAEEQGNTVAENARLFALINIAQADAGIGAWDSKYYYDFWRPIVAIREADLGTGPTGLGDGNALTVGDPTWVPLGAPASNESNGGKNFTPPFPAYPSGHATFGAAVFHMIELFYGTDDMPFTFMSDEMNGTTTDNLGNVRPATPRTYARLSDAIEENAKSRIYLGIHWEFDKTAGIDMGEAIADYIFANFLLPVEN